MAVAVGRNINDQRNVEARSAIHNGFRIFSHTAVQHFVGIIVFETNGIEIASAKTSAATNAFFSIDRHFSCFLIENKTAVCTLTQAEATSAAFCFFDKGFSAAVLLCLARSGAATHTDILDRATKTGHFVTLEVRQADEYIGVHNGSADLCFLNIFTADNGNFNIVRSLKSVSDDNGATDGKRSKTVFPSALKMFERIFSASGIHGVAVRKERLTTKLFDYVYNSTRIVGAQITDIAKLTEMKLDRNKFAVEIKIRNSCRFDQSFQFCGQSLTKLRTKIRKIYFCFFHCFFLQSK